MPWVCLLQIISWGSRCELSLSFLLCTHLRKGLAVDQAVKEGHVSVVGLLVNVYSTITFLSP